MVKGFWLAIFLLGFVSPSTNAAGSDAHGSSTSIPSSTQSSTSPPATCRSGTVNYITHSLPQQCLRTNYSPSVDVSKQSITAAGTAATATVTPHLVVTVSADEPSYSSVQHSHTSSSDHSAHSSSGSSVITHESPTEQPPSVLATGPNTATTTTTTTTATVVAESSAQSDQEFDSPLDNAKFLSFEDWKKQNLIKIGQPIADQKRAAPPAQVRARPDLHNALDGLGEDSEIEIDLIGGFGSSSQSTDGSTGVAPIPSTDVEATTVTASQATNPRLRSKDAGKTCKERFNFASFDCAANVLKTNDGCKSPRSVLVENKDSYMLNKCSIDNKFLIVELCDPVLIDTIVLANFEFFSSMFRAFRISVSEKYPIKLEKWKVLGTYEARNTREIQAFLVENPMIFARYLRVEFLTHYGAEYYCPLSLLRVHGTTMMEEYRRELAMMNGELEEEEDGVSELQVGVDEGSAVETITSPDVKIEVQPSPPYAVGEGELVEPHAIPKTTIAPLQPAAVSTETPTLSEVCRIESVETANATYFSAVLQTCHSTEASNFPTRSASPAAKTPSSATIMATSQTSSRRETQTKHAASTASQHGSHETAPKSQTPSPKQPHSAPGSKAAVPSGATVSPSASSTVVQAAASSVVVVPPAQQPQPPATQESFFKSIHKRLQALEANSTLSLQYIESQSRLLREAFAKVEKRNLQKTSSFLETLNSTVLTELARFKADYEQLWQSTVIELAHQREEGKRERDVMGERLRLLAEEMVAQKRLMAAQATLILLCVGLVVFGKFGGSTNGVDAALAQGVQGLMLKGRRFKNDSIHFGRRKWQWDSPWASPPRSRGRDETSPVTDVQNTSPTLLVDDEHTRTDADVGESGSGLETSTEDEIESPRGYASGNEGRESFEETQSPAAVDGQDLTQQDGLLRTPSLRRDTLRPSDLKIDSVRSAHTQSLPFETRSAPTTPQAIGKVMDPLSQLTPREI